MSRTGDARSGLRVAASRGARRLRLDNLGLNYRAAIKSRRLIGALESATPELVFELPLPVRREVYVYDRRDPAIAAALRSSKSYRGLLGLVVGHKASVDDVWPPVVVLIIPVRGRRKMDLDTVLHELLHVAMPEESERYVGMWAELFAATLWCLGWRSSCGRVDRCNDCGNVGRENSKGDRA